jgi:hypothetical protein
MVNIDPTESAAADVADLFDPADLLEDADLDVVEMAPSPSR